MVRKSEEDPGEGQQEDEMIRTASTGMMDTEFEPSGLRWTGGLAC